MEKWTQKKIHKMVKGSEQTFIREDTEMANKQVKTSLVGRETQMKVTK